MENEKERMVASKSPLKISIRQGRTMECDENHVRGVLVQTYCWTVNILEKNFRSWGKDWLKNFVSKIWWSKSITNWNLDSIKNRIKRGSTNVRAIKITAMEINMNMCSGRKQKYFPLSQRYSWKRSRLEKSIKTFSRQSQKLCLCAVRKKSF